MEIEFVLRWLHIIGACVLLGTGIGIAFFMVMAHRTKDARLIAHTADVVIAADWLFTASAVVVQPITGVLLALKLTWPLTQPWILLALALYVVVGLLWLPVLRIQHRLRDLARAAVEAEQPLPPLYYKLYRAWFVFGVLAFLAVLAIVWLMIARPLI